MEIYQEGPFAYLSTSKAAVIEMKAAESINLTVDTKVTTVNVQQKEKPRAEALKFVSWGAGNKLPMEILEKVYKNVTVSSNLNFNSQIAYGAGLMVVKKVKKDGKITYEELIDSEAPEVFDFIARNNVARMIQELANDVSVYYDSYCEFLLDSAKTNSKIIAHRNKSFIKNDQRLFIRSVISRWVKTDRRWATNQSI